MQTWTRAIMAVLDGLFGAPGSLTFVVGLVVSLLSFLLVLSLLGKLFKPGRTDVWALVLASGLGALALLVAASAARLYVRLPRLSTGQTLLVVSVVALLVVVVPLFCLLLRARYLDSLGMLLVSVAAAVVSVWMVTAVWEAVAGGSRTVHPARLHKRLIEEAIR